jgi:hypothetical protein
MLYSGEQRLVVHILQYMFRLAPEIWNLFRPFDDAFREGLHGLMRPIAGPRVGEMGRWLTTAVG